MRSEQVIPSAARLMKSLRDLGYEFTNAVADLVDNSISHGAARILVTIHFDGPGSWVRIADNGDGMNGSRISEAMRLGSAGDYDDEDLGKFGLGLKTASLSQCRKLSVASRTDPNRRTIEVRQLDLDHVTHTDRWEIHHLSGAERPDSLVDPLRTSTGTVVKWENLDRVLSYDDPWGRWAQKRLLKLSDELDLHLGMVFGRFLSGAGGRGRRKLEISINGQPVEAWDPFVEAERKTEPLPGHDFPVVDGLVRYQPFVLPARHEFSSEAAWRRASGPRNWNQQQGFYIYRGNRLIQSGGWARLRTPDEHTKLARAALEFWPGLDDAFEINISKMRVKLPEELRKNLEKPVAQLIKRAQERYRGNERVGSGRRRGSPPPAPATGGGSGRPNPDAGSGTGGTESGAVTPPAASPEAVGSGRGDLFPASAAGSGAGTIVREPDPQQTRVAAALARAAARAGLADALERIKVELVNNDPGVARELGW